LARANDFSMFGFFFISRIFGSRRTRCKSVSIFPGARGQFKKYRRRNAIYFAQHRKFILLDEQKNFI
jgi:hypothetical protein